MNPTPEHKEQARALVDKWRRDNDWPGLVWSTQNFSDEPRWLAAWQDLEQRIAVAFTIACCENRKAALREAVAIVVGFPVEHYSSSGAHPINAITFRDGVVKALEAATRDDAVEKRMQFFQKSGRGDSAYANSRDTEIRQVLEGLSTLLRYTHGQPERCWCNNHNSNWTHTQECLAARALYAKLQRGEESLTG